jgi:hypothetical protein
VIDDSRAIVYAVMLLDTLPSMETAQQLYRSLGFRDGEAYRHNPVEGAWFMRLELTSAATGTTARSVIPTAPRSAAAGQPRGSTDGRRDVRPDAPGPFPRDRPVSYHYAFDDASPSAKGRRPWARCST